MFEDDNGAPSLPKMLQDLYQPVYFEAHDSIIAAIKERFEQPGLSFSCI